jgi:hypothetical protein
MIITNLEKNQSFKLRAFVYNLMTIIPSNNNNEINQRVSIQARTGSALAYVSYGDVISIQNDETVEKIKIIK